MLLFELRSRLLDDCVRPDSPSDLNPLNDNAHRTISRYVKIKSF